MGVKYFHELTNGDYLKVIKMKYEEVERLYKQPDWCKENHAIKNCWSLHNHSIENIKSCKDCPSKKGLNEKAN